MYSCVGSLERDVTEFRRGLWPTSGFAASLLAVWCQILLLATISLTPLSRGVDPIGYVPVCHADDDDTQPAQPAPKEPAHDCALCVVCLTQTPPQAILAPGPTLPARRIIVIAWLDSVQARAPPFRRIIAARPRGPPALT